VLEDQIFGIEIFRADCWCSYGLWNHIIHTILILVFPDTDGQPHLDFSYLVQSVIRCGRHQVSVFYV